MESQACRKAVAGSKNTELDIVAEVSKVYQDGKIALRPMALAVKMQRGRIVSYPTAYENQAGMTASFKGKPYYISLNPNGRPFSGNDLDNFQAWQEDDGSWRGELTKIGSEAKTILHEFRHWFGDKDHSKTHSRTYNREIYSHCFLANPRWHALRRTETVE